MKKTTLLLLLLFMVFSCFSQKNWWRVDDIATTYKLPDSWTTDPFSSSSVCDCIGTINNNGVGLDSLYVGMVIYPVDLEEKRAENRKQVWGHTFHKNGSLEIVEYNGIEFQRTEGTLRGLDENKAWQLVSIDKPKKKHKHLIIYFWSHPETFEKNMPVFEKIMESMERVKV